MTLAFHDRWVWHFRFAHSGEEWEFVGELSSPIPLVWSSDGVLKAVSEGRR